VGRVEEGSKNAGDVEAEQGQLALMGNRFGAKAFSATLDAQHQNAAGSWQTKSPGFARERQRAFVEPILEHRQTADLREILAGRAIFQKAAFADDLLFFSEDLRHVFSAQPLSFNDDFSEDIFCFTQG